MHLRKQSFKLDRYTGAIVGELSKFPQICLTYVTVVILFKLDGYTGAIVGELSKFPQVPPNLHYVYEHARKNTKTCVY